MNSNPSRPGLREGGADALELLLDVRGGEVLEAFNTSVIMRDKHRTRTLRGAKSVKFPAFWNAKAHYHTPGVELTGGQIASQDVTVDPDDKLVSDVFVSDVDEMLFDVEVRSPYTRAIGRVLAETYDTNVMRTIAHSARQGPLFAEDQGGSTLVDATFASDPVALFDGFSLAKETMDTKRVPVDSQPVYGLLRPAEWYMLARSDRNLNRDYNGGQASNQKHTLTTIDDISILKSNITPFGENSTLGTYIDPNHDDFVDPNYQGDFTNTRGLVWTPYAAASVIVQDLGFQMEEQIRKQGMLLLGRMMTGTRPLRSKTAVELAIA